MSSSVLDAAFAHHVWATLRVLDACLARSAEEMRPSPIAHGLPGAGAYVVTGNEASSQAVTAATSPYPFPRSASTTSRPHTSAMG